MLLTDGRVMSLTATIQLRRSMPIMTMLLHSVRLVAHLGWMTPDAVLTAIGKHQYRYSWMQATVKARQDADHAKSSP
jgi:hypothetical protein